MDTNEKHEIFKYVGIFISALIGAFLAFYFVADMTFHRMFSPEHQMKKMERMMNKDFRRAERMDKMMFEKDFMLQRDLNSFATIAKENNNYIITVDLKIVNNNPQNIEIDFDNDGKSVTVEGAVEKQRRHGDYLMKFSETFILDRRANVNKVSSEHKNNKLIYIIPLM